MKIPILNHPHYLKANQEQLKIMLFNHQFQQSLLMN